MHYVECASFQNSRFDSDADAAHACGAFLYLIMRCALLFLGALSAALRHDVYQWPPSLRSL